MKFHSKEEHVHKFDRVTTKVPVHNYVIEKGKPVKDLITAADTLMQFVCECGKVETYDLKRKLR